MQIDRRRMINGLAWAGAALIVAIPTADLIARQFAPEAVPQVSVVQTEPETPAALPTPASQRPAQVTPATPASVATPSPVADPVTTANAAGSGGDALDSFIQSGRPLPSYISNGGTPTPPVVATPTPVTPATTPPAAPQTAITPPFATVAPEVQPARPVIATPRAVTGFPTPVSERPRIAVAPAPAPAPIVQPASPPLIINNQAPVVTAQDLEDWESGPLSDFLANRGGQRSNPAPSEYDGNGFWLDQGPGTGSNRRIPPAYDDYYYPFGQ